MIDIFAVRVPVACKLYHLDTKLKLPRENVLQVLRNLINDDQSGERAFEHHPLKQIVQVAEAVGDGVALASFLEVSVLIDGVYKDLFDAYLLRFKRKGEL